MNLIQQITSAASQSQQITLSDGTILTLQLQFIPIQQGWYITSLTYQSFTLSGFRISNSGNILHQYRNQIPFGIACFSNDQREPSLQQDFSSGNSNLYLLSAAETLAYAEYLLGNT